MANKELLQITPKYGDGLKEITVHERFVLKLYISESDAKKVEGILVDNSQSFSFEETVHKKWRTLRIICTTYRAEVIKQLLKGLYGK